MRRGVRFVRFRARCSGANKRLETGRRTKGGKVAGSKLKGVPFAHQVARPEAGRGELICRRTERVGRRRGGGRREGRPV